MKKYIGIAAVAILALSGSVWAQNAPLIGTWKLNLSKSIYDPGPAPQSLIHRYESVGKDTCKNTRDMVDADGKSSTRAHARFRRQRAPQSQCFSFFQNGCHDGQTH